MMSSPSDAPTLTDAEVDAVLAAYGEPGWWDAVKMRHPHQVATERARMRSALEALLRGQASVGADPLWAVHVRGPDDIVPVPSYEAAVLLADHLNWWWAVQPVTENDAIISAVLMLWDGAAGQHAVEVVKLGTKASDYRLPTPEQVERAREKAFAARVAIPASTAAREPTARMLNEGGAVLFLETGHQDRPSRIAQRVWEAMYVEAIRATCGSQEPAP